MKKRFQAGRVVLAVAGCAVLAVCGLTHRQSYKDIFAVTCIKTMAVFVVIGIYYVTKHA